MITGLDRITAKIVEDAKNDAASKIDSAKAECSKIDTHYRRRCAELRDSMLNDAEIELSGMVSRARSSAAIEKRNAVLAEKSDLVDEAFMLARNDILNMEDADYLRMLTDLLTSVIANQVKAEEAERRDYGGNELETAEHFAVMLNKKDREKHGDALIKATNSALTAKKIKLGNGKLILSDDVSQIDGGFILVYGDITINCSLSMIFSRLRETAETEVYRILFKDKE